MDNLQLTHVPISKTGMLIRKPVADVPEYPGTVSRTTGPGSATDRRAAAAAPADIAAAAGCDPDSLHRVLGHLVGKGVFLEPAPGHFALNQAAQELLDPSQRLGLDLMGIGGRMAYAWGTLLNAVRTGTPAYHELFGRPFWEGHFHDLLNDIDKEVVLADIQRWIDERIPAA